MAKLDAHFQFDFDLLNLNWFIKNIESFRLDQDVFDPWEDRYSTFTEDDAIVLHGRGFGYDTSANMYKGTVEAVSQWFYDDVALAWTEAFLLSDVEVPSLDVYNAMQSAGAGDDLSLLQGILSGKDMFNMSMFDDTARGFAGGDTMLGFAGSDTLFGDAGRDTLRGGSGDDKLVGGGGSDTLLGGQDDDILRGGGGDDILRGGEGRDKLIGGSGEDLFVFKTGDGKDIVKDFQSNFLQHDSIDLSGLDSVVNWKDLRHNHMEQVGDDVVIDGGDGDLMILRDTDIANLSKLFFDF